jgi:hypothetical protein
MIASATTKRLAVGASPALGASAADASDDAAALTLPADAAERAVARLRPAAQPKRRQPSRPEQPGVLEGFVPVELAGRGPRTLRPADRAPFAPPPVIEAVEWWADRETLFGDA